MGGILLQAFVGVCMFVLVSSQSCVPTNAPTASRVCQIPTSGNVQWLIPDTLSSSCAQFNNPLVEYNDTQQAACVVSSDCITILSRYYCSLYCAACTNNAVLNPCQDLCENYTRCRDESPCIPPLPGACSGTRSWDPRSASFCTALAVNVNNFPDILKIREEQSAGVRPNSFMASVWSYMFEVFTLVSLGRDGGL